MGLIHLCCNLGTLGIAIWVLDPQVGQWFSRYFMKKIFVGEGLFNSANKNEIGNIS